MVDDNNVKYEFDFATEAEALAFQKGIEFVNDSAIDVTGIGHSAKGWTVVVTDSDANGEGS